MNLPMTPHRGCGDDEDVTVTRHVCGGQAAIPSRLNYMAGGRMMTNDRCHAPSIHVFPLVLLPPSSSPPGICNAFRWASTYNAEGGGKLLTCVR